ncbi:5,10-methylenetetrahydrofolate reductase [Mobilicoccus massiliensis]|uniref:5,10-methylenetetrahydrofolate reductase n=1 Tax=Mobilicoccus massiliensis TaxID=1522310 RepID=UPI000591720A|nr:5,10-methylenetetrahydrofolate reductase [Mobilicoccus massiliensis]
MPDFAASLADRDVLLLFGMTPPRVTVSEERAGEIAAAMLHRLAGLDIDGLVLYDLDDESERTDEERPFPYLETMDPAVFRREHLTELTVPAIVYRSISKYDEGQLTSWLGSVPQGQPTVFVGAPSSERITAVSLPDAQALCRAERPDVPLGAVMIPERHTGRGDEHKRLIAKQEAGVSFFVSQVVYDVTAAKNLASDYAYSCRARGMEPARLVFTLSLCGSIKTLKFLGWLGVDVPQWVQNELKHTPDPLGQSVVHALETARELRAFCRYLGVPVGFNVESVSTRRAEIDAAAHVARQLAFEMRR